ncbi:MAG: PilZ domain-containing protein, partial [Acidobacteriota bacterium]|nr:PilZ domain-containing protein [Acidobacteriota bacterium]
LEFPVAYWDPEQQEQSGKAADLSASGLGFFVEVPATVGVATRVRFTLPASKETFELLGTVRSASGSRIGIQFSEMDDLASAQLLSAIFAEVMASRPDVSAVADPVDVQAMVERLARIENAIALVSSEIKRESLTEEAEALRALISAHQKALARLDS